MNYKHELSPTNYNRVQIYDCEIGVVKCFAVYFPSPLEASGLSKGKENENIFSSMN
jgi:hypothetical protein